MSYYVCAKETKIHEKQRATAENAVIHQVGVPALGQFEAWWPTVGLWSAQVSSA